MIKHTQLMAAAPHGIAVYYYSGYRPSRESRFCVVRENSDYPWHLVHVRSGGRVDSLRPTRARGRSLTLRRMLTIAKAFDDEVGIDWVPFDALKEVEPGDLAPEFGEFRDRAHATAAKLRVIAAGAV